MERKVLNKALANQIELFRGQQIPFVMLSILIREFDEYCTTFGEESGIRQLQRAALIISRSVREFKDIPSRLDDSLFMMLLPATGKEDSVNLAIRLFVAFHELKEPELPVSIGIVEFMPAWGKEKIVKIAKQAAKEAADLPPPSLCLYDGKSNRYRSLSEVHQK